MPFELTELKDDAEFKELVEVERLSYETPLCRLLNLFFPIHGQGPEARAAALHEATERHIGWHRGDPSSRWLKVIDTETGRLVGAACWHTYENNPFTEPSEDECMWFPAGEEREMANDLMEQFVTPRMSYMGNPHMFLEICFVHPDFRRRGAGRLLMNWGVARADELEVEAYIDATVEGKPLYEAYGFVAAKRLDFQLDKHNTIGQLRLFTTYHGVAVESNPCFYQGDNAAANSRFASEIKYIYEHWGLDVAANDYPASRFRPKPDTPIATRIVRLLKRLAEWFPKSGRAVVDAILTIAQTRQNQPPKKSMHQRNYVVLQDIEAFLKSLPMDPETLRLTVQFPEGNFAKPRKRGREITPPTNPPGDHNVAVDPQEEDHIDPRLRGDVVDRREASGFGHKGRKDSELLAIPDPLEQGDPRDSSGRSTSGEAFARKRDELLEEFVRLVQKQTEVEQIPKEQAQRLVHRAHLIQQQCREFNEDVRMVIGQRQGQRHSPRHSSIPIRSGEPSVRSATGARSSPKAIGTPSKSAKERPSSEVGESDRHGNTVPLIVEADIPLASVQSQDLVRPLKGLPKGGWDERNPRADEYDFNSCAIDCIATLFKLLRDRAKPKDWESKLTSSLAGELFKLVDRDWDISDRELNKAKMPFYNEAIELYGDESSRHDQRYLQHLGVADILTGLHGDLINIVGFETDRRALCTECRFLSEPDPRYFTCIRSPDSTSKESLIMGTVRSFFADSKYGEEKTYCANNHPCDCYMRIVNDLPDFLFVMLDGRRVEHDSTPRRQEVRFRTFKGSVTGTYGWLGSICYRERDQHYKLFWAAENPEELLSYDHHDGPSINGYRHGRSIEDAIPEEWWTRGELVVLQRSDLQEQTRARVFQAHPEVMPSSGATYEQPKAITDTSETPLAGSKEPPPLRMPEDQAVGAVDVEMEDRHEDEGGSKSDKGQSPQPPSPPVPRDSSRRYKGTRYIIKKVSKPSPSPGISLSQPNPGVVTPAHPFGRSNANYQEMMADLMTESEGRSFFQRSGPLQDPHDEPLLLIHNRDLWRVTDTIPNQLPGLPTRQGHADTKLPPRAAALQHLRVLQTLDNVWRWKSG